jgi:hypothetical protein
MTVYLVDSLPRIPYVHRVYMVLANPTVQQAGTQVQQVGTQVQLVGTRVQQVGTQVHR